MVSRGVQRACWWEDLWSNVLLKNVQQLGSEIMALSLDVSMSQILLDLASDFRF